MALCNIDDMRDRMRRRIPIRDKTNTIGCRVRSARLRSRLTQAALADKIRTAEKSRSTYKSSTLQQLISRLERGEPITNRDHVLRRLTEILGPLNAGDPTDVKTLFSRPVLIDISTDGTITYRRRGEPPIRAFPIFSVSSEDEARRLQTYLCQEIPLPDPRFPGNPRYVFVEFAEAIFAGQDFGDLYCPTVLEFAEAYEKLRSKK